jgi:regulatory protein
MEAAAAFLAVRPRSVAETRRRLRHLGYPHELVDQVVARLVDMRYLDDETFARAWVESRDRARPRGESALRRELALKGVDREVAARVLAERTPAADLTRDEARDETGMGEPPATPDRIAAERLMERRRAGLEREPDLRKRRQKAYALLARNGFDPEVCREVAASIAQG